MKKLSLIIILLILTNSMVLANSTGPQIYETRYRLDTGVIFVWKNSAGTWQKGQPGKDFNAGYTISLAYNVLPKDIYDVKVYQYNPEKFSFKTPNFLWYTTVYANSQLEYNFNYHSSAIKLNTSETKYFKNIVSNYNNQTDILQVTYTVNLTPVAKLFDVKETIKSPGGEQIIYDYMGLTPETAPADFKNALGAIKSFHPNVEGYLYFVPTIIEYKVRKSFTGDINYLFSTFNDYTINREADIKSHTFWMMAPEVPGGVTDEFLVEVRSHIFDGDGVLVRKVHPLTNISFNEGQVIQTIDFTAEGTPIDATIWRRGLERNDLPQAFKEQFFRGYTKQHNGGTYYFYGYYQSNADGEMYPTKRAFDKAPATNTQSFIGRYGFTNINDYEFRVLNP